MPIHEYRFQIPGDPEGCRRPRGRAIRTGTDNWTGEATYSCRMHKAPQDRYWQAFVQGQWMQVQGRQAAPKGTPVNVLIQCYFRMPKSASARWREQMREKLCTKKPDLDNVAKNVLDALTASGTAWADDSQIARLSITKRWCGEDEEPMTDVLIMWRDEDVP